MENFVFAINTTLPIFLVMVLGYALRQCNMLNDEFVRVANKFNFRVTLSALLFRDLSVMNLHDFDVKYVLLCAGITTVMFWSVWGLSKVFIKDKEIIGAFVQGSFRSSVAVMGLAFITNMYGNVGMGPMMIIGCVPLYNIYSVIVLTFEANDENQKRDTARIKKALKGIITNPIIISIAVSLVVAFFEIDFPTIVDKTVGNVAAMATPLALVTLGASFEGRKAIKKIKPTVIATLIKLMVLPAVFTPIAILMGYRNDALIAVLTMLGSPTTPSCFIMAKEMKNDGVLTASIIVLTTFFSAFTFTAWIYLFKTLGLI